MGSSFYQSSPSILAAAAGGLVDGEAVFSRYPGPLTANRPRIAVNSSSLPLIGSVNRYLGRVASIEHQGAAAGAAAVGSDRRGARRSAEIQSIQDVQRGKLRETNRRSREIRRRGRSLCNKLAASVQSIFGVDSMALLSFGVKPRLQKPRRRLTPDERIVKLETEPETWKAAAKKRKG